MICISINQESRRLALADMVNAKLFGDISEVRLDRFGKSPEIGEMVAARPQPVIMTCRRVADGGNWEGTETERLAILRQCIISKADYVEIELDVADDIRPFPPAKRVISYTNLSEIPLDIQTIYDDATTKKPDVIKLVMPARTPEEAWPLVQILAKAVVPTVVVGLGKPGIMLALLSKKIGAPWVYAALEPGLEAYPGQPLASDLKSIYRLDDIQRSTRLIGVTGFGERELITVAVLNAVFASLNMVFRCLPMAVGNMKTFGKVIDAVKLACAIIDPDHQADIMEIKPELHGIAKEAQAADVLIHKGDSWHGMHVSGQVWVNALKNALKQSAPAQTDDWGESDEGANRAPFKDRFVLIAGVNGLARLIATEVQQQQGNAIIATNNKSAGQAIAAATGCRFVGFDALYSTMHDILVVCDPEVDAKTGRKGIHPGYLKPGMQVADLTASAKPTELLSGAVQRGCEVVGALNLLLGVLEQQVRTLTGKQVSRDVIRAAIPERFL